MGVGGAAEGTACMGRWEHTWGQQTQRGTQGTAMEMGKIKICQLSSVA
jgi:hypothetical protein